MACSSNNGALLAMLTSTPNVLDNTELTDQLTWAFNSGSEHFNYLAAGQSLVLTYTITVTDSQRRRIHKTWSLRSTAQTMRR
jgi:hypothetical protein